MHDLPAPSSRRKRSTDPATAVAGAGRAAGAGNARIPRRDAASGALRGGVRAGDAARSDAGLRAGGSRLVGASDACRCARRGAAGAAGVAACRLGSPVGGEGRCGASRAAGHAGRAGAAARGACRCAARWRLVDGDAVSGCRGQSTIEALLVVPLCVLCACGVVEAGVLVRDRLALQAAVSRAAVASVEGRDVTAAAQAGLPRSLRSSLVVDQASSGTITVGARPRLRLVGSVARVRLEASVVAAPRGGVA